MLLLGAVVADDDEDDDDVVGLLQPFMSTSVSSLRLCSLSLC